VVSDTTQTRQKIKQARQAYLSGDYAKARSLLKGVNHPKADALIAQIDEAAPPNRGIPILPLVGIVVVVILVLVGSLMLLANATPSQDDTPLPTLIPTSDCTQSMVDAWWMAQEIELSQFVTDASSASRTMPGERLDGHIRALQAIRDGMEAPPVCISASQSAGYVAVLDAMYAMLEALNDWATGRTDGTAFSLTFGQAEDLLRQARAGMR
jgi:biopolymer transport protein ExbD